MHQLSNHDNSRVGNPRNYLIGLGAKTATSMVLASGIVSRESVEASEHPA